MTAERKKLEVRIASLRGLIDGMFSPANAKRPREYLEELERRLGEQKARDAE